MDELLRELDAINAMAHARADYAKTLVLLRALKAGTILLSDVTLTSDGWQVAKATPAESPPAEQPA